MPSCFKEEKYRNKKLLKTADGAPCSNCGAEDGTVVWAHSNLLEHGKGRGTRSHDHLGMHLCYTCHTRLDQGMDMSREEKRLFILENIVNTYNYLIQKGFWKS